MANPDVSLTVLDGGLGLALENIDGVHVKLGIASSGTPNTFYSFSRPEDVTSTLGFGPLPQALVDSLTQGGGPVYAMPISGSVAGSNTAVSQSGGGPLPTLSGTPLDAHDAVVNIILGGAVGVATFQYSLDGGDTFSPTITTVASYPIPNAGTTILFTAGTYVIDEQYTWTGTATYFNTTDLNTTFTALLADPREWFFVHVVGRGTASSDSATLAAAIQSQMDTAATQFRYARAMMEIADDTDANIISDFASVSAIRLLAGAGFQEYLSKIDGRQYKRPATWPMAARAVKVAQKARVGIATHLGRVADGPLGNIVSLIRDEAATPGLDAQRIATLRTIVGRTGFFVTRPQLLAPAGSDFDQWQIGVVMDKACRITRDTMLGFLNDDVRLNTDGTITELEAVKIEGAVDEALQQQIILIEQASSVFVTVDRAVNIASTKQLLVDVRLVPLGYLEDISVTIGYDLIDTSVVAA